ELLKRANHSSQENREKKWRTHSRLATTFLSCHLTVDGVHGLPVTHNRQLSQTNLGPSRRMTTSPQVIGTSVVLSIFLFLVCASEAQQVEPGSTISYEGHQWSSIPLTASPD